MRAKKKSGKQLTKDSNRESLETNPSRPKRLCNGNILRNGAGGKNTFKVTALKKKANIEEFSAIEKYKQILSATLKTVAARQAEVLEEIKKEISASSIHTIREISKSIQRANEKRRGELQNVSNTFLRASEQTAKQFADLAESIKTDVKMNYDQLSQKLSETTKHHAKENKNFYSKVNKTVADAKNSINKTNLSLEEKHRLLLDKLNEIKQNTEEIQQREEIFQEMLRNFREAAAAKSEKKKWWQIWSK